MAMTAEPAASLLPDFFPTNRQTPLPGGYMGRVLHVDLTSGRLQTLQLPEEAILRRFWGGQALATYVLLKLLPLDARPLGPENPIVMMTGPVTGTGLTPAGTKICSVYLSPTTGYTLGRAATSGHWAVMLKAAGFDGMILTGAAEQPTYLYIDEQRQELRDARALWGMGTRDTEDALHREVGLAGARVACIGPAGEHLVPAAMLVNDYNHNAAHGIGAVMGSKKLKAIVTCGTRRPTIHDRAALIQAGLRWRNAWKPFTVEERRQGVGYGAMWGAINRHNWRATVITDEGRREENRITQRPCFQCHRLCPWDAEIGGGRHQGTIVHFNAGAEWLDTFYNLDLKGNDVLYLAERINDLGLECSHFADGAGLAFEAWEKGLLGPDKTDGLQLTWGNFEAVERLLERCCRREGWLGNLIADGPKALAQALGGDASKWVVHVKGGTPAQHEWRPLTGAMLSELTASGGMKPQGGGTVQPPPDLGDREPWGPLDQRTPTGWPRSHFLDEQCKQFCGLMGACWFAMRHIAPDGLNCLIDALNATTGWNVTIDEALAAGHRSIMLQSLVGTQRGWKAEDDWADVGPRFLEPVPDGQYEGFTIAQWLPELVQEYHRLSGRHETSGRPLPQTLEALDLHEFAEWAEGGQDETNRRRRAAGDVQ